MESLSVPGRLICCPIKGTRREEESAFRRQWAIMGIFYSPVMTKYFGSKTRGLRKRISVLLVSISFTLSFNMVMRKTTV
jgi:hypothetical protein